MYYSGFRSPHNCVCPRDFLYLISKISVPGPFYSDLYQRFVEHFSRGMVMSRERKHRSRKMSKIIVSYLNRRKQATCCYLCPTDSKPPMVNSDSESGRGRLRKRTTTCTFKIKLKARVLLYKFKPVNDNMEIDFKLYKN